MIKITPKVLTECLQTPIADIEEQEFRALAFLLSWEVARYFDEKVFRIIAITIIHQETTVDVVFNPYGLTYRIHGEEEVEVPVKPSVFCTLLQFAQYMRSHICREYAVTIWKTPVGEYTVPELEELSDILMKAIFV